ncbi:MAG: DUF1499 domain-containing protein, partial [Mariprofundaceae bacterium]|nr:DUF1499 domain-containing protein [Mariprofundaceae bacterium]
ILLICIAGIALLILAAGFVLGVKSKQPPPLGLVAGHLRPCPASPNCVSSEAAKNDTEHYTKPLPIRAGKTWSTMASAIEYLGGHIVVNDGQYLHAIFTSALFRYVDDVEARLDASEHVIHLRSASRVGRSDLGANRKRIDSIRAQVK